MADFPFIPNWRNGVTVRLSHKTDIFTSRDGHEQRRALRETARRSLEFSVQLHEAERTGFHAIMSANEFTVADPVTFCRLVAPAAVSATVIAVDDATGLVTGDRIAVRNGNRWQFITLTGVTVDGFLTLATGLSAGQSEGSRVHRTLTGRFTLDGGGSVLTSRLESYSLTLEVEPGAEYLVSLTGGKDVFDGREVWLKPPSWVKPLSIEMTQERETTDYTFGRVSHTIPANWVSNVTQADYLNVSAADADQLVELFQRNAGRAGEMFVPTWRDDMHPTTGLTEGSSSITVAGTEVADLFDDHPVYQAFVLRLADGRRMFRMVVSMSTIDGNTVITVNREWAFDVATTDIVAIHWLPLQRFSADSLSIDYLTDEVSQFRVSTMTLPYRISEASIEGWTVFADVATEFFTDLDWMDRFDAATNIRLPSKMSVSP